MGIMDIFKMNQPPQAPKPGELQAPTVISSPTNANLPVTPPAAGAANPDTPPSPMDGFSKLWENDPTKTSTPAPLFDIDPTKFAEAVKTADFTKMLPPDLMAKALAGDAAALGAAMNGVAQQVFSHQTMATTKLIEQALDKRDKSLRDSMPGMVRSARVSDNLADLPLYKHEATRPLIAALEAQLSSKYPQATAAQITEQAQKYISEFATLAAGDKPAAVANPNEPDWGSF